MLVFCLVPDCLGRPKVHILAGTPLEIIKLCSDREMWCRRLEPERTRVRQECRAEALENVVMDAAHEGHNYSTHRLLEHVIYRLTCGRRHRREFLETSLCIISR